MYVDGNGNLQNGGRDQASELKQLAPSGKWKVAPDQIPEPLKKAWRALEFGQTSVAAPLIKQALSASDAKVKEAAQKLEGAIKEEIAKRMASAKSSLDGGDKWAAFKSYNSVTDDFKDFADAKPALSEASKLKSDAKVTRQLQAKLMLEQCQKLLASQKRNEQEQGRAGLKQIAEQFKDTEAGETAAGAK
jgi:hypothetical protein